MQRIIVAMRGRYKVEGGTAQRLEPQFSGLCNTLASVQKDNLVLEEWDEKADTNKLCMDGESQTD